MSYQRVKTVVSVPRISQSFTSHGKLSCWLFLLWLQLGHVHLDSEAADMNVSAVALAAVDIAATALDSALLSVERTVERSQQRPEVSKHACSEVCASTYHLRHNRVVADYSNYSMFSPLLSCVSQTHGVVRTIGGLCSVSVPTQVCMCCLSSEQQLECNCWQICIWHSLCFALVCKFVLDGHPDGAAVGAYIKTCSNALCISEGGAAGR